jgi:hypothetical protein
MLLSLPPHSSRSPGSKVHISGRKCHYHFASLTTFFTHEPTVAGDTKPVLGEDLLKKKETSTFGDSREMRRGSDVEGLPPFAVWMIGAES